MFTCCSHYIALYQQCSPQPCHTPSVVQRQDATIDSNVWVMRCDANWSERRADDRSRHGSPASGMHACLYTSRLSRSRRQDSMETGRAVELPILSPSTPRDRPPLKRKTMDWWIPAVIILLATKMQIRIMIRNWTKSIKYCLSYLHSHTSHIHSEYCFSASICRYV